MGGAVSAHSDSSHISHGSPPPSIGTLAHRLGVAQVVEDIDDAGEELQQQQGRSKKKVLRVKHRAPVHTTVTPHSNQALAVWRAVRAEQDVDSCNAIGVKSPTPGHSSPSGLHQQPSSASLSSPQ